MLENAWTGIASQPWTNLLALQLLQIFSFANIFLILATEKVLFLRKMELELSIPSLQRILRLQ